MSEELKVSKIVATPKTSSWSQVYNAGKLFAVLSLERRSTSRPSSPESVSETGVDGGNETELASLGKQIIENLEAEFFTLEEKNMESIKSAIEKSFKEIPSDVSVSLAVGAIVGNILYAYGLGRGKISIKRGDSLGTILEAEDDLSNSSGFLEDNDIVIFQTSQFAGIVTNDTLGKSIDSQPVEEIAETLAPLIHGQERGGASSLILLFKKEKAEEILTQPAQPQGQEETIEPAKLSLSLVFLEKYLNFAKEKISKSLFQKISGVKLGQIERSRKTFLTVAVLLVVVFLASVFIALKRNSDQKTKALYNQYYVAASKKYDEAQSLLELNRNVGREDLTSAQKLLTEGQTKFSKGSSERKQVDELLDKVNKLLASSANIKTVQVQPVDSSESKLLNAELSSSVQFAAKEDSDIYTLDSSGVSKNGKILIKKDWGQAGGLGVYFGNVYVLDKTVKQILKFISTSSEHVKTNYFSKDTTPDVSSAKSIAIDGSIWVLLNDGTVFKFTRGNKDNFQLSGLDKGFSSPTRIFTNADSDNVYILDNGNSRIVVFDKEGAYQSQYQSPILKAAKDFEVLEKSKKVYILSGGKIYLLNL